MGTNTSLRRALLALGMTLLAAATLGAAPALAADAAAGRIDKVTVHGRSLENNLSGDKVDREVHVYLPPGYATSRRRYPVVYFLHGFGLGAERYAQIMGWPANIDRAIAGGKLNEMIVVMPDAMTPYGGSMYSNSITTGDWEAFVARDLVTYVDSHYRTIARRESRGLSGHSMGGYGTLRIGMKYPDVYIALYAMSACCLDPRGAGPADAGLEKLASAQEVAAMSMFARTTLAASAAWAPDAARPPFFLDLPTEGGQTQLDVLARYAANAPAAMVSQYASQLRSYKAIVMDIGLADPLKPGNEATVKALQRVNVEHRYETYDGDHTNKVPERFERQVVPFFSGVLKPQDDQ